VRRGVVRTPQAGLLEQTANQRETTSAAGTGPAPVGDVALAAGTREDVGSDGVIGDRAAVADVHGSGLRRREPVNAVKSTHDDGDARVGQLGGRAQRDGLFDDAAMADADHRGRHLRGLDRDAHPVDPAQSRALRRAPDPPALRCADHDV